MELVARIRCVVVLEDVVQLVVVEERECGVEGGCCCAAVEVGCWVEC